MKFVWWNVRVPSWFYIIQLRRRRGGTCRSRGHQRKKKQKRISWIPYWKYKVWYSNLYLIIRIFKNQKNVPSSTLAGSESWWKDQTWENIECFLRKVRLQCRRHKSSQTLYISSCQAWPALHIHSLRHSHTWRSPCSTPPWWNSPRPSSFQRSVRPSPTCPGRPRDQETTLPPDQRP